MVILLLLSDGDINGGGAFVEGMAADGRNASASMMRRPAAERSSVPMVIVSCLIPK